MPNFQSQPFPSTFENSQSMFFNDSSDLKFDSIDITNLPWYFKEAILNPNKTHKWYFTENGFQYCRRATWNNKTKVMTTNWGCPVSHNHHLGSTCKVCKLKD
jgi:hypothetical protein